MTPTDCQTRTASQWRCGRPNVFLLARCALLLAVALICGGCGGRTDPLVVYSALDRDFSEPVLEDFAGATGMKPVVKYDIESTKTVGLTQALIAEAIRPRCDVFWNNEILNTLRLERRGLLAVYRSPQAEAFPEMVRSPEGTWCGFAARARVLLVNTKLVSEEERPTSIYDLTHEKWKGRIGMAKPLFGTTASHAACLFAALGEEAARKLFRDLKTNDIQILSGNKQVAQAVAAGQIAFGLTDTDDAIIEVDGAQPVTIVYPDREEDELGTLFIPNTVCILKNCPHPEAARKLVDYLLTPGVEAKLSQSRSAQIPLNPGVEAQPRVETPKTVKAMRVDFAAAAAQWEQVAEFLRKEFLAE
jgi:iron(III) transport system substrate-binding protein